MLIEFHHGGVLGGGVPLVWGTRWPSLCAYLERERLPYVMAIPKNTTFGGSTGVEKKIEIYAQKLPPERAGRGVHAGSLADPIEASLP